MKPKIWKATRWALGIFAAMLGIWISHAMDSWRPLLPHRYNVFRMLVTLRQTVVPLKIDTPVQVHVLLIDDDAVYLPPPHPLPWHANNPCGIAGAAPHPPGSPRPIGQVVIDTLQYLKLYPRQGRKVLAIDLGFVASTPDAQCRLREIERLLQELSARGDIVVARHYLDKYDPGGNPSPQLRGSSFDGLLAKGRTNFTGGFVNLDHDRRRIQIGFDGQDSFAAAIARRIQPDRVPPADRPAPATRLFREEGFGDIQVSHLFALPPDVVAKGELPENFDRVLSSPVLIIGAGWRKHGASLGPLEDDIGPTPFGRLAGAACGHNGKSFLGCLYSLLLEADQSEVPGVYAHASYVESLLSDKSFQPVGHYSLFVLEFVALGVLMLFGLVLRMLVSKAGNLARNRLQRYWTSVTEVILQPALTGMLVVVCVFPSILAVAAFLLIFGVFWDPTIPMIVVLLHALFDEYVEAKEGHLRCLADLNACEESRTPPAVPARMSEDS